MAQVYRSPRTILLVLASFLAFGTGFTCDSDPSVGGPHPEPPEPGDVADPGFGSNEVPGAGGAGGSAVGGGDGRTGAEPAGGSPTPQQPIGGGATGIDGADDDDAGV